MPRGVSLLIGCRDFPVWNGYPSLFASLVTGNPVIVKPHPAAVLPLAVAVRVAREVLEEAGYDPNAVALAADRPDEAEKVVCRLATHPAVRIVDHTDASRPELGDWLERHALQAVVFRRQGGLNTVVVDSTDDYAAMLDELALALSWCGGRMRTTPRNILVPAAGLTTDQGRRSFARFCADLGSALDGLLADPGEAAAVLGAVVDDGVRGRLAEAGRYGTAIHPSRRVTDPRHPGADIRTPLVIGLRAGEERLYTRDWAAPVSCVVATASTARSLDIFRDTVRRHGAVSATVHSTDQLVLAAAEVAALDAGVHLAQNPAGAGRRGQVRPDEADAALTDPVFVAGRFLVLQSRRPVAEVLAAPA